MYNYVYFILDFFAVLDLTCNDTCIYVYVHIYFYKYK